MKLTFSKLIAFLTLLEILLIAGLANAETFVADLADKPGMNYGTMLIESGTFGVLSCGGKVLFDRTKEGRQLDFVPALFLSIATIAWHAPMYLQGSKEREGALIQDAFEAGGAFVPVVFKF